MNIHRPVGIKLVAIYFCLRASAIILALVLAQLRPEAGSSANDLIANLLPIIRRIYAHDYEMFLAPIFAFLEMVLGLGIWFLRKWARTLAVWDLMWEMLATLDMLSTTNSAHSFAHRPTLAITSYIEVEFIASMLILVYLFNSAVKKAFGVRA
jgi:hypothetical protein